jgi:hypothetical protein
MRCSKATHCSFEGIGDIPGVFVCFRTPAFDPAIFMMRASMSQMASAKPK